MLCKVDMLCVCVCVYIQYIYLYSSISIQASECMNPPTNKVNIEMF